MYLCLYLYTSWNSVSPISGFFGVTISFITNTSEIGQRLQQKYKILDYEPQTTPCNIFFIIIDSSSSIFWGGQPIQIIIPFKGLLALETNKHKFDQGNVHKTDVSNLISRKKVFSTLFFINQSKQSRAVHAYKWQL